MGVAKLVPLAARVKLSGVGQSRLLVSPVPPHARVNGHAGGGQVRLDSKIDVRAPSAEPGQNVRCCGERPQIFLSQKGHFDHDLRGACRVEPIQELQQLFSIGLRDHDSRLGRDRGTEVHRDGTAPHIVVDDHSGSTTGTEHILGLHAEQALASPDQGNRSRQALLRKRRTGLPGGVHSCNGHHWEGPDLILDWIAIPDNSQNRAQFDRKLGVNLLSARSPLQMSLRSSTRLL